jgi:hypothetical protein
MAYSTLPIAGCDLVNPQTVTSPDQPSFGPLGAETFASDGKRYVYAQAGAAITASTTTCSVNASTFIATPSAGTYAGPLVAMASGDYGWFSKASV